MIKEVLTHITHHLDEEISLQDLAQLCGYSPYHLHRQLKQELQVPIGSFIKRQRMEKAAYLLSLTQIPVAQIREMVGYSDDSAFSRAFRDIKQCSPTQYRTANLFRDSLRAQEGYVSLAARTTTLPDQRAIVFPSLGDYFSKDIYKVWQDVKAYIRAAGVSEDSFEYYAVFYGCQNVSAGPNRYDAAIVPRPGVQLSPDKFFESRLPEGRFACYTFCCPVAELKKTSLLINKHFFGQPQWHHREGVSYFKFHHLPDPQHPDNQLTTWLLPIS
ncbi:helix-turn-helix domain-containing protein [Telluribacter sp.]|jgi:AraC family transcriptional regulator|uniref:helix-turn-helix domain-containing protein n=1 Tax=Telluribacter sp. TaxID=1978767 RepID=UPI002E1499B4|nr:helix-turn-helix domain-containing protein [Telluribacter sp.]